MNNTNLLLPDVKFRFNIDHPTLEECYSYGYQCARAEVDESNNPYQAGSRENELWLEGWWDGFYEYEPLFRLDTIENIEMPKAAPLAINDERYEPAGGSSLLIKVLEITGVIAVSLILGYQVFDLVA